VDVQSKISALRRKNRPYTIAVGVICGIGMIMTDFYLPASSRVIAQQLTWSAFDVGLFVIFLRSFLRRKQLWLPFILTLLAQAGLMILLEPFLPVDHSLLLFIPGCLGIVVLGIIFALFARVFDHGGERPL
jgi:hypothetical protein